MSVPQGVDGPANSMQADPMQAVRRYLRLGLGLSFALVFGLGGWAVATEIAGAVIASGHLVVESNVKKVQHPSGGVIGEIAVKEGMPVKAGDILMRLDPTVTRANLAIISNSLDQMAARQARLEAERNASTVMVSPKRLQARLRDEDARALIAGEESLFALRTATREGQKSQLQERISQLEEEISGQIVQRKAKEREIALINSELEGVRELHRKNLVPVTRVNLLEREGARIQGELGLLVASTSSARGKISEIRLQIIQIDQQFRSEVAKELREIEDKTAELVEREISARDQLKRIDIRAPQDGIVHGLAFFTIGGVVSPGEALMSIVPNHDSLAVEVRVTPQEISHIYPGQGVMLRIAALNQRTTPELDAIVDRVGADLTTEPRTGASFYTVRIRIDQAALMRLEGKPLVPGMPVESFFRTEDRSVMSYLTKPLTDQFRRAFRET